MPAMTAPKVRDSSSTSRAGVFQDERFDELTSLDEVRQGVLNQRIETTEDIQEHVPAGRRSQLLRDIDEQPVTRGNHVSRRKQGQPQGLVGSVIIC
jgi:hypothetical protein